MLRGHLPHEDATAPIGDHSGSAKVREPDTLPTCINRKDLKKINVKDEARRSDEEAKDSADNSDANPRPSNSSWSSNEDIEVEAEASEQQSEEDSDFDQSSSMPDEESEVSVNSI